MPLPTASTQVSFPAGSVQGRSAVVAVHDLGDGRYGIATEATPFHPLDHTWPDQPADTGTLTVAGAELPVVDCLTGAVGPDADALAVGADIPVRRGEDGWAWLVLHVVESQPLPDGGTLGDLLGAEAELRVDAERRAALSAAHTGCHLLALALNAALAPRWRKDPGRSDAFGHPDFDSLAMSSSRMDTAASTDVYRLGKSLRKKGFTADATDGLPALAEALPALTQSVNEQLAAWIEADAAVRIEVPGPELTARRRWACDLPAGTAAIFCGGTHLHHLGELAALSTELRLSEDGSELTAVTTPKRR
ncbi:alanyl-tRNA editing protein [Peterkaempfera bronchialis]|uniref:Metal-dependent hydrolase n=1 Tax=Peterkaempfera bronchialis TaxID=2126346 RepID=A0A345SXJ3_9ACTN|nr:metal-dependent hydrolase [Peterkaempfera bronchialis]AXI78448.1 metal-dependent hydrolase [Peterkaempfera bronchialis]